LNIVVFANSYWNIVNFRKKIILRLINEGHHIKIIIPFDKKILNKKFLNCEIINISMSRRGINPFMEIYSFISLYKNLKKIKIDFILNYTIKPVIYGSIISKFLNIRCINTVTGLGSIFISYNSFIQKIFLFIYKMSLRNIRYIFFHNKDDFEFFLDKKIVNNDNASFVNGSGIDLKKFNFCKYIDINPKKFIMISRILVEKGIYDLIEAIKILRSQNYTFKFYLIGSMESKKNGGINKEIVDDWVKNKYIHYVEFTDEIRGFIKNSSCFILPSYREGSSKAVQESMVMGRPVIVSDCPGNKSIVKDFENGLLFETKNPQDLAKKIILFDSLTYDQINKMSLNANKLAIIKFDEEIIIQSYIDNILKD
jgi:glycosyltransferase involved in cell wall biosynthesis